MDCDTTGIEPDFALVKYKKLAGGGVMKMINSSIPPALAKLGYSKNEIEEIVRYCVGSGSLSKSPEGFMDRLRKKGFTDEIINRIDSRIRDVITIEQAFHPTVIGKDFLEANLGIKTNGRHISGNDVLENIGFTSDEIRSLSGNVCGTGGIEGAPYLKPEHYTVFDTASVSGENGTRSIHWKAHVGMMAAVQPFITGAISKTINMPEETTIEEVKDVFRLSWKSALKAISVYRDGCKLSQPLTSVSSSAGSLRNTIAAIMQSQAKAARQHPAAIEAGTTAKGGGRTSLPHRRNGYTQKAKIGGHSIFLRTGEYKDGKLGEIFLDMYKEGAAFRSLLNSFAIAVSFGLQYGVPLEEYVEAFTFTRFEPNGIVQDHDYIKMATSVIDFVFRDLALNYLKRTDLVQVKPDDLISTATMEANEGDEKPIDTLSREDSDPAIARRKGYEGNPCTACGNFTLLRNGTCFKCDTCGSTTGCS
jgi:ribonucleoside-diphosphate reductase alpha chain